ncbi:hypothetical protein [Deinococcus sp. PEB2-63]
MQEVHSAAFFNYTDAQEWWDRAPYDVPKLKADAEAKFGAPLRTVSVSHTAHFNPDGSMAVTYLIVFAST